MTLYVKGGPIWIEPITYVKDGTVWKKAKEVWINDNGTWKLMSSSSTPPPIEDINFGTTYLWGDLEVNDSGGRIEGYVTPYQITSYTDCVKIQAYRNNTIYVLKNDGTIWAKGPNSNYQLGDGTTIDRTNFVLVGNGENDWADFTITAGGTVALKNDGTLWGWGTNWGYRFGNGEPTSTVYQTPTKLNNDSDWKYVQTNASYAYAFIALKSDNSLWGWGPNNYGVLANGGTDTIDTATQITTNVICASVSYKCLAVLKDDGTIWWAGTIQSDPTDIIAYNLTKINNDTDWICAKASHAGLHAIKANGTLWYFGKNLSHTSGAGPTYDTQEIFLNPIQIGTDNDWYDLYGGLNTVGAKKIDGTLWSWGWDACTSTGTNSGQQYVTIPTKVGNYTDWGYVCFRYRVTTAIRNSSGLGSDGVDMNHKCAVMTIPSVS